MFRDGVVWGLASMSKSKDVTIARLCSVALCNLSCEYWKDIAMSNSVQVPLVVHRTFLDVFFRWRTKTTLVIGQLRATCLSKRVARVWEYNVAAFRGHWCWQASFPAGRAWKTHPRFALVRLGSVLFSGGIHFGSLRRRGRDVGRDEGAPQRLASRSAP